MFRMPRYGRKPTAVPPFPDRQAAARDRRVR